MRPSKARRFRVLIEDLADFLEDAEAVEAPELFRIWKNDGQYRRGQRVRYGGVLYRCLQDHTARDGWNPVDAPSLWAGMLRGEENA